MHGLLKIEIRAEGREPARFEIPSGVYTVGRDSDCKIHLPHDDVDTRHAILNVRPDASWIEDLDSESGTFLDGERIHGRKELAAGRIIRIGPFVLVIESDAAEHNPEPEPRAVAAPPVERPVATSPPPPEPKQPPPALSDTEFQRHLSIKEQIHKELVERLDIKRLTAARIDREELRKKAAQTVEKIVHEVKSKLPPGTDPKALIKEICDEALGLGPLEEFIADPEITEIMVNGHRQIYIEKGGKLVKTDKTFMSDTSVLAIIERIVSPIGRRIDESQPYVDARLPDGSRVNAIIHPLSLIGPCLTIRKFSKIPFTVENLIEFGTLAQHIADLADTCVKLRKNIVVSGGTGTGKTTFLNVLSGYLPPDDRIVTIEDAAELRLTQEHVVRLEARPPNIEGRGAVAIRDLVRNALRMRPDRIVVGECRGGEALDMLQAMNTGHDGSLTTIHANSPRDVISRLETMVLMSGMDLPVRAIREQIASAIDVIIHLNRFSDGSRKVTRLTEVVGLEGSQITMHDIFEHTQTGLAADGKIIGAFRPTGAVPTFTEDIATHGLTIDLTMFDPLQHENAGGNKDGK